MNWVSDESHCRSKTRALIKIIIFVNCLSFRQKKYRFFKLLIFGKKFILKFYLLSVENTLERRFATSSFESDSCWLRASLTIESISSTNSAFRWHWLWDCSRNNSPTFKNVKMQIDKLNKVIKIYFVTDFWSFAHECSLLHDLIY